MSSVLSNRAARSRCGQLLLWSVLPLATICRVFAGRLQASGSERAPRFQSMAYSSEPGAVVAYVTVPDAAAGKKLAYALLEHKVVACVNILPGVTSIYRWKGTIEEDDEQLLVIKTKEAALPRVVEIVKSNHPYDEPECIALPIVGGSASYMKWLHDSVDPTLQRSL